MRHCLLLVALASFALASCQQQPAPPAAAPAATPAQQAAAAPAQAEPSTKEPEKLATQHLPNAWRIHAKVISGGQPHGEEGFQELAELGVKTVISVDGAMPDVEAAKKHGLRYVHLPHGYDGIPEARVKELAKAVRELPGPIYIHCHHGKHRSPAAASVACVSAGLIDPKLAVTVLKSAGTSEAYRGLYGSAGDAKKLDDRLLDELAVEYPETAKIPPLAEAMVGVEHTHDHLKTIAAAGWKPTPDHPDIEPAHEALLLREHYTELLRSEAVKQEPEDFQRMMQESEAAALALEKALAARKVAGYAGEAAAEIPAAFKKIEANCAACHKAYRDVPLGEKGR
jgi:protein tyrosine phosphatase (PTP) superfamily phosphohydrolase (DUF442 family)